MPADLYINPAYFYVNADAINGTISRRVIRRDVHDEISIRQ